MTPGHGDDQEARRVADRLRRPVQRQLEEVTVGGTAETPALTLRHRLANGMRLTSTVTLRPDGQTEWQLAIDNPTELEVCEIRFPVLTGVKLGDEAADDWMFEPKCWGQVWKHPAAQGPQTDWGPSMRWMAMWDDSQGIYFGIEDAKLDDYAFVFGGDSSGGTTLAAAQRILCEPRASGPAASTASPSRGGIGTRERISTAPTWRGPSNAPTRPLT